MLVKKEPSKHLHQKKIKRKKSCTKKAKRGKGYDRRTQTYNVINRAEEKGKTYDKMTMSFVFK